MIVSLQPNPANTEDRSEALQRMNYQSIQQWYGHQARNLAFWSMSLQLLPYWTIRCQHQSVPLSYNGWFWG
jgi:hypothetical protein